MRHSPTKFFRLNSQSNLPLTGLATLVLATLVGAPVFAQDAPVETSVESVEAVTTPTPAAPQPQAEATTTPSGERAERIEVTGSRIKRIDIEGASPVLTVTSDYIEKSSFNSVSDVLRELSVASFGVGREASGGTAAGVSTIGLRGLGDQRTLVLLNGRRLPRDPAVQATDLNLIPIGAVDRIEVLKDGASAIYGSDALGGVVNIITKKNFDGADFNIQQTVPELVGGKNTTASLVLGSSSNKTSSLVVFDYRDNEQLFGADRDFTRQGLSAVGTSPAWRNRGISLDPADVIPPGPWSLEVANPAAACPPEYIQEAGGAGGEWCFFPFNSIATTLPRITQQSLLTEYSYKVNSNMTLVNRNLIVRKNTQWRYAPVPGTFSGLELSNDHPGPLPTGLVAGDVVDLRFRFLEGGNRDRNVDEISLNSMIGVEGYFGASSWSYLANVSYNRVQRTDLGVNGDLVLSQVRESIASGAFNPWAAPGARGNMNSGRVNTFQLGVSELVQAEATVSGEIFDLPAGPIAMAAGVNYFTELFSERIDFLSQRGEVFGSSGASNAGDRVNSAAYVEFNAPVTSDFELSLAARYDTFSDFGTAFNPKLSARWQPSAKFLTRASIGTGFLAPTLKDLYETDSFGFPSFIDRFGCAQSGDPDSYACRNNQYEAGSGGNTELKEERALSVSLGTVVQPTSDINFTLDTWYTKIDNVRGLDYEDMTLAELNGVNPADFGVTVPRVNGQLDESNPIYAPNLNLSRIETAGLDFGGTWVTGVRLAGHTLRLSDELGLLFFQRREGFPGAGFRDVLDEYGAPKWRNGLSATFASDKNEFTLQAQTIPGQKAVDRLSGERIDDYTEFHFSYTRVLPWKGTVSAGIRNVLGSDRPTDPVGGPGGTPDLNQGLYDPIGRRAFVSYRQSF